MMKILIIDDESDVIRYLSMVLEDQGYEVLTAQNCEEAGQWLERRVPDLICLDIMMPKESGLNFYAHLKADEVLKRIPVFMVSAVEREKEFDIRNYINDCAVPPPEQYFEKPIEVEKFLKVVKQTLGLEL